MENLQTKKIKKKIISKIKLVLDKLLLDNKFICLKKKYVNKKNFGNFKKLILYYNKFFTKIITNIKIKNFSYKVSIRFNDDNGNMLFNNELVNPYIGEDFIDNFDGINNEENLLKIYEYSINYDKDNDNKNYKDFIKNILHNKKNIWSFLFNKWSELSENNITYFGRVTPGTATITYSSYANQFYDTSQASIKPANDGSNAFYLQTCGKGGTASTANYWNGDPTITGTGAGGSGGYIRCGFRISFTYNTISYSVDTIDVNVNNDNPTKVNYKGSDDSLFSVSLKPGNGINGVSSSISYEPKSDSNGTIYCSLKDTKYGSTGSGGVASITNTNHAIHEDYYFFEKIISNGKKGGDPNSIGGYGYTSAGSGVNTKGYTLTLNGGSCNSTYNYPNGLAGNPVKRTYSLGGSAYTITSQGGGNTVVSSGYGAGGGASPPNWKIGGVNQTDNIKTGRPGFCEILYVYV
jgi:hypothetical protein